MKNTLSVIFMVLSIVSLAILIFAKNYVDDSEKVFFHFSVGAMGLIFAVAAHSVQNQKLFGDNQFTLITKKITKEELLSLAIVVTFFVIFLL